MKHIVLLIAFACCITACEKDNNSSRFDDLISSFDLSQMDQDQFVAALTTDMLCVNDVDIYEEGFGWGYMVDGLVFGWYGILCNPDGTSKYIATHEPRISAPEVSCVSGKWTYNTEMGEFSVDRNRDNKIVAKVVYYQYPRVILEGIFTSVKNLRFQWDCSFSKENPQKLLDRCTIFIDVDE